MELWRSSLIILELLCQITYEIYLELYFAVIENIINKPSMFNKFSIRTVLA